MTAARRFSSPRRDPLVDQRHIVADFSRHPAHHAAERATGLTLASPEVDARPVASVLVAAPTLARISLWAAALRSNGSFDAAFACAVLQHLADPLAAVKEIRRVLKPGGVIGIVDGSSTITFRYPTTQLLERWDKLRGLEREYNTGHPSDALPLRALLREAGFARTQASGTMSTEAGPPAGSLEETRRVAQNHLIRLHGVLGELAVAQGWVTKQELEQVAEALMAWGEAPDAFYSRPVFTAIGWA